MKHKILIVSGDPNSINSEIIYKTFKNLNAGIKKKIYIISNFNLLDKQFKKLKLKIKLTEVKSLNELKASNKLKIINVPLSFKNPFKVSSNEASKFVIKCLNMAHSLAMESKLKGIINCPVDKTLIKKTKKIGITELLASKCNIKKNSEVMMIYNKNLSVVPLTTHIRVKNVSKQINYNLLKVKMITLNKYYKKLFNKKPKVGILGLNPHNAELSKDSEEILKIKPSILKLKKKGLNALGPLVSDTLFIEKYKKFNVIVGMYHDQVLTPFKSLFHFDAINITLGLNYIRVSPDHGPGRDIVGKKKANSLSLTQCVKFINQLKT